MRFPVARRTRTLAATAALAVSATTLAACGSSGPGGGERLEVWVYQDGSTTIQQDAVERFNESSDVQINLTEIPGENYQDRMRTAMGSPNAPDVFFNWGGGSISDFVAEDMLVDLTDTIESEPELQDAFIQTILDAGAIEGRHYGIPMRGVQPTILFYNATLFDEAGLEPPETWDAFLTAVDTFVDDGVTPVVLGGADPWTYLMWFSNLVERYGGAGVFQAIQDGEPDAWGDPAVLQAAETATELVDAGTFGNNFRSISQTTDGASTYFAQGGAAMHLMGSWEYPNQLTNQPEFAENDLAWTPFPALPDGEGDPAAVVGNPTNYWSVNSEVTGDRLDAAIEFLKQMASEEYTQSLIENGDIPTTANAEELLDSHGDPEYARFQYEMVEQAPDFTLSWDQALPARQATPMLDNLERLFGGQLDPEQFVDAMRDI